MSLFERVRHLKLRTKVAVPIAALLTFGIIVTSAYMIQHQEEIYGQELLTSGETMIHILAKNAESGVLFETRYELDELLSILPGFDAFTYAAIYNNDGVTLSQLGNWREENIAFKKAISQVRPEDSAHHCFYVKTSADDEFIEYTYPVVSRKERLSRENLGITGGFDDSQPHQFVKEKIGTIKLILSLKAVNKTIAEARWTATLMTLSVLVLAILILAIFIRAITRPIKMLVEVTDQVSRGDLNQRVNLDQHDEIGHLADTFNRMIESLRQSRDEIEEYNRNLEEKIVERTLALEEAQAQLIQSEKMSAIGQLAAGVAHELNNPLGGILGYAQFALEKLKKITTDESETKDTEGYIQYLTHIEDQARRCKTIVQNLLRFSRSSQTTEFDQVNVNQVIEDTRAFVEHQLHMNQISLRVDLAKDLPVIEANASQLQQVFTNLIINAMHASSPESVITITTRTSPAIGEFGGAVEVKVLDSGEGIPPELRNKIFEPFFTTKEVGKGTGLGLSVSYGIIREHGGEIRVDSTVGEGATFTIILPVQKTPVSTDNPVRKMSAS